MPWASIHVAATGFPVDHPGLSVRYRAWRRKQGNGRAAAAGRVEEDEEEEEEEEGKDGVPTSFITPDR